MKRRLAHWLRPCRRALSSAALIVEMPGGAGKEEAKDPARKTPRRNWPGLDSAASANTGGCVRGGGSRQGETG